MSSNIITNHNKIIWKISTNPIPYLEAISTMELIVNNVIIYKNPEVIWLLSHPHTYTKGISAKDNELLTKNNDIPVISVGRGGKFTYHGPGQKIIYPILDLRKRGKDIKKFIKLLELWIIKILNILGIDAFQKPEYIGVWVKNNGQDAKIAAIGVRISKWVSSHGIALNVNPNLHYFKNIIPCGITNFDVTSLEQLNVKISENELNLLFKKTFSKIFYTI